MADESMSWWRLCVVPRVGAEVVALGGDVPSPVGDLLLALSSSFYLSLLLPPSSPPYNVHNSQTVCPVIGPGVLFSRLDKRISSVYLPTPVVTKAKYGQTFFFPENAVAHGTGACGHAQDD